MATMRVFDGKGNEMIMSDLQLQLKQKLDAGETIARIDVASWAGVPARTVTNFTPILEWTELHVCGHYYNGTGVQSVALPGGRTKHSPADGYVKIKIEDVTGFE